jgi:hypothetical protein
VSSKDSGQPKDRPKGPPDRELTEEEAEKLADRVIFKPGKGPRDQPPPSKGGGKR